VSTTGDKAKRVTVEIGDLEVEGFQMPDGSYQMSQSSAAEAVGLGRQNVSDFLRSKAIKGLLGESYTGQISKAERNTLLAQRLQQTEAQLEVLGEAYAEPELLREENERLRQQIRELGSEPNSVWIRFRSELGLRT